MNLKNEKIKVVTFFGPRKIDFKIDIYLKLQNVIEELLLIDMSDIIVVCFDAKRLSNEFNDVCSYATLNGKTLINIFDYAPQVIGKK